MNVDKIVAEMPKAENPYPDVRRYVAQIEAFGVGVETQCQLLAEQEWRKVPSEKAFVIKALVFAGGNIGKPGWIGKIAEELHCWLLERDSAGKT